LEKVSSIANGPKLGALSINMPWAGVLKLLVEITITGMNENPDTYFDRCVTYEKNKRKNNGGKKKDKMRIQCEMADSDDDFVPMKKKKMKMTDTSAPGPSRLITTDLSGIIRPVSHSVIQPAIHAVNTATDTQHRISVIMPWPQALPPSYMREDGYFPITPGQAANNETSEEEVEPITPPTRYNKEITRSKHLELSERTDQEKTPKRLSSLKLASPRPTSQCFYNWKEDEREETLSVYKAGCLVQVIGINRTSRNLPCNIRISDGKYWLNVEIEDKLRINFVGKMVVENDILVIQKTSGTLKQQNFKIIAFVRPQWAQCGGVRYGQPVPLEQNTIITSRGGKQAGIIPLLSSMSIDDDEYDRLVMENDVTSQQEINNRNAESGQPTDEATSNEFEAEENCTEDENPNWVFSKEIRLSQMLRCTQTQPTVEDTPLVGLKLTKNEIRKMTISSKVSENATHLYKTNYETSNPTFDGLCATWKIPSEFNDAEYEVKIEWPDIMPRTPRAWNRTFPPSCTCPGYLEHGPARYCKHIDLILLKHFSA
jgi:hypothetical protein